MVGVVATAFFSTSAIAFAGAAKTSLDEIAPQVMCPSCDTTLDRSDSPAADRMRAYINGRVADGWTEDQILDGLVAEYGGDSSILATPKPDTARGALAWGVPVVVAIIAALAGLVCIQRWRKRAQSVSTSSNSSAS
jgi:cytochrome c-type biogenesis protein CcmH/NrfF